MKTEKRDWFFGAMGFGTGVLMTGATIAFIRHFRKQAEGLSDSDLFKKTGMELMIKIEKRFSDVVSLVHDAMREGYDNFFFDKLQDARVKIQKAYSVAHETNTVNGWKKFYEIANQVGSTTTDAALADVILFSTDRTVWKGKHKQFLSLYNSNAHNNVFSIDFILKKMHFRK